MATARKERRAKRSPSSAASIGGPFLPSSAGAATRLEDAQDLTQDFFLMILKGDLLQRANADRGRFRSLLLTSLQNFLIDSHAKAHARKRGGDVQFVSWDDWMAEAPSHLAIPAAAVESWPAERIFDVRWAATVAEQALRRLQEECESRGRRRVFDVLSTALTADREDVSYEKLARELGVERSRDQAALASTAAALSPAAPGGSGRDGRASRTMSTMNCVTSSPRWPPGKRGKSRDYANRCTSLRLLTLNLHEPLWPDRFIGDAGVPSLTNARVVTPSRALRTASVSPVSSAPVRKRRRTWARMNSRPRSTPSPLADTHWRLGNYEILEEIGRGGMGVIYRARQRHSRRIVALKRVLSYHADSRDTLARFRREAEAAASLDHPNILPIYEVGESEDGVPFFSMKYASGGSLQEVGPALRDDPREIVRLMAKVARAVQYAHRQGILHRDLKPGNILLDGRGEPLVSDFGLAKWLDTSSDLTRTLTIFGTPGYIAPEQAEGPAANLKPAADVYSLGAILFDLLSGRPPFLGEHALAVIRQAADKPAPKLRSLVQNADRDLETICARCLEREPDGALSLRR